MNTGYFTSFTIFLAFSDPDFCNKYLREVPQEKGARSAAQRSMVCTAWHTTTCRAGSGVGAGARWAVLQCCSGVRAGGQGCGAGRRREGAGGTWRLYCGSAVGFI